MANDKETEKKDGEYYYGAFLLFHKTHRPDESNKALHLNKSINKRRDG
jgi:hypothetical protein